MAANSLRQTSRALADGLDPLQVYRVLREAGHQPILLAGAGAHPGAGRAVVAFTPLVEIRYEGKTVEERWASGEVVVDHVDPVKHLDGLAQRYCSRGSLGPSSQTSSQTSSEQSPEPFTGGLVGYFGYGFAGNIEPTLLPAKPSATPDALLRLCLDAVVFDLRAGTVRLWCSDIDGELTAAEERLRKFFSLLSSPASTPPRLHNPSVVAPRPANQATSWAASMDQASFEAATIRLQGLIRGGDLFQANLATRFSAPSSEDPADLFAALRKSNPSPFMALLEFSDHAIVSGSPEELFCLRSGRLSSRPIAGTRRRGVNDEQDGAMEAELLSDKKEQAEHTMLVDLVRNDLARVCRPGTVHVSERMSVERYRHVMHLVSEVQGVARESVRFVDVLAALFPAGR